MDSGFPLAPSFAATYPMMPTQFMGMNPPVSYNGMQNFGTQSAPFVSSHSPVDMPSPSQPSPWSTYMNPSIGFRGTMSPMLVSSFDMSHVPQPAFMTGGWNFPSYESNPSYSLSGSNTQMSDYSTYYTPSMYPSSTMSVPSNTFSMVSPHVSPGVSYGENQFYGSGYLLHRSSSQGGNIYPHSNNPYHTSVFSQTLVMMPIQTSLNQLNEGYYLSGQGQGVNQDPSWPTVFQSQYLPGPWHKMPQSTAGLVTISHTRAPSPTSSSHVGDGSTTSTSYVDNPYMIATSHAGGTTLVATSYINATSSTYEYHVGDDSPTFVGYVDSMPPIILNDTRGIEKPKHLRHNPKFLCRTYEGSHLTHLCPATTGIPEAWGSPKGPSESEASVVSPYLVPPIDMTIMSLQYSLDHTHVLEGDVSIIPVTLHPLQCRIEEVVVPAQSLVNPTLPVESDASFNHVVSILDPTPSELERVFLSPSPLPPGFEEITFDWDSPMGYPIPPPMSFSLRDIFRSITEIISSVSALSSSSWRALGFPKLMSAIHKILTFRRRLVWEPWPPPLHVD
jgi:hypothetical protein